MARLIDAEGIKYITFTESKGNGIYEKVDMVERDVIDMMPTVDAIPVEWIEKWRVEKGRHMSERLVAGKIIVDWKWSLSEEDRKKYDID